MPRITYTISKYNNFDDDQLTKIETHHDYCKKCYSGYRWKLIPSTIKPSEITENNKHLPYEQATVACTRCLKQLTEEDN